MGNGDAATDARGAKQLALENGLDHLVGIAALKAAGDPQTVNHLADDAFLAGRAQLGNDRVADHEISDAHAGSPYSSLGSSRAGAPATCPVGGLRRWSWIFSL